MLRVLIEELPPEEAGDLRIVISKVATGSNKTALLFLGKGR